jgi:hypothetical protein
MCPFQSKDARRTKRTKFKAPSSKYKGSFPSLATVDHPQRRCFSRAVFTEQAIHLSRRNVKRNAIDRNDVLRFAAKLGAKGLSMTASGRNLHTWTPYTGLDPESQFLSGSNFGVDQAEYPQLATFVFTLLTSVFIGLMRAEH